MHMIQVHKANQSTGYGICLVLSGGSRRCSTGALSGHNRNKKETSLMIQIQQSFFSMNLGGLAGCLVDAVCNALFTDHRSKSYEFNELTLGQPRVHVFAPLVESAHSTFVCTNSGQPRVRLFAPVVAKSAVDHQLTGAFKAAILRGSDNFIIAKANKAKSKSSKARQKGTYRRDVAQMHHKRMRAPSEGRAQKVSNQAR